MFERWDDYGRRVLKRAEDVTRTLGHDAVGTEHLLDALATEPGPAAEALAASGVTPVAVAEMLERLPPGVGPHDSAPPFTPRAKKVLELAVRETLQLGHNRVGGEHVLLGLVREGEGSGAQIIQAAGVTLAEVRQAVIRGMAGAPTGPRLRGFSCDDVEPVDLAFTAADLLSDDEASELFRSLPLRTEARLEDETVDGVRYWTATYRPAPARPTLSLSVVDGQVAARAFADLVRRIPDAESVDGLGDAAVWSPIRCALWVLAGEISFTVWVRNHLDPKTVVLEAAERALANLARLGG